MVIFQSIGRGRGMRFYSVLCAIVAATVSCASVAAPKSEELKLENFKANVEKLAGPDFKGRGTGQPGNTAAVAWVEGELDKVGLPHERYALNTPRGRTENLIAWIKHPFATESVVIGAHIDHLGTSGTRTYWGADDNASGSAMLLEIAKLASQFALSTQRNVYFQWYSGEELGLYGSEAWVRNPTIPISEVKYMINMDMVGYLRNNRVEALGCMMAPTICETLKERVRASVPSLTLSATKAAGGGSDHVPFARKGIPVTFFYTGTHQCYHQTCDTPEKINYDGMVKVATASWELLYMLMSGVPITSNVSEVANDPSLDCDKGESSCVKKPCGKSFEHPHAGHKH